MDERNEDGKVNMPPNEFDFGVFTTCLASCFSGKACFSELEDIDICEGCVNQKETDKLNAWKTCIQESIIKMGISALACERTETFFWVYSSNFRKGSVAWTRVVNKYSKKNL